MPYKDAGIAREAAKLRKRKQRMSHPEPVASEENVTPGEMSHLGPVTPDITLNNVTPDVTPYPDQGDTLPRIIKTVADAEAVAAGILEKCHPEPIEPGTGVPTTPELLREPIATKRRRGGLKMGFEPWRQRPDVAPALDLDGNIIPEDM